MKNIIIYYPPSRELLNEQLELLKNKNNTVNLKDAASMNSDNTGNTMLQQTASNYPTMIKDGMPLHSRHNPVQEAMRQISEIHTEFSSQYIIFFGAGIGYSIYLFLNEKDNRCIWFESDPEILIRALSIFDFKEFIESEKLRIITEIPEPDEMHDLFSDLRNKDIVFTLHRSTFTENSSYRLFFHRCENYLNKKDVNIATLSRFDRMWASNFLKNITHLKNARPVQDLFNKFNGIPALICGAGPSLSESIDDIKKYRNKFIVIAVDTSLKILYESGIDPDITVSVDPQPINREYIEGYDGNSVFVADLCSNYLSLRNIPENRLYYFKSPFALTEIFYSALKEIPESVAFGGSVSTNAYDLAVHMGCDNVYLTGMDLSFSGGRAHAKGAVLEEKLNHIESRIYRREMHNYRQLSALPVKQLKSLSGNRTRTNDKLIIFHKWFEGRFAKDLKEGIHIYNLTAEGAEIHGAEKSEFSLIHLREDADSKNILNTLFGLTKILNCDRKILINSLKLLRKELEEFKILTLEGESYSKIIYNTVVKKKSYSGNFQDCLNRLNEIDSRLLENKNVSSIISGIVQKAISIVNDEAEIKEKSQKDVMIAKKSLYFYGQLTRACNDYIRWLNRAIRIEEQ